MNPVRSRRIDLDLAKGLGIFLVVFGHLVAKTQPRGNLWYTVAQTAVYTFHMPFFLYLSGYVTFLTGAARVPAKDWPSMAAKRASRLLQPFLLFGAVFVLGKLIAAQYIYVDNAPRTLWEAVVNLLWNTDTSPAISIWYMFVIFVAGIVTPGLIGLASGRIWLALAISLVLFLTGLPHRLFADRIAEFYLFFMLGGLAAESETKWLNFVDRYHLWLLGALGASIVGLFLMGDFSPHWSHLLCGTLCLPALHGLVRRKSFSNSRILVFLGRYSFVIYLLNTPVIGVAKGLLMRWVPWDGTGFLVHAPILLLLGLCVPVLIKVLLFKRLPYLDRITN